MHRELIWAFYHVEQQQVKGKQAKTHDNMYTTVYVATG